MVRWKLEVGRAVPLSMLGRRSVLMPFHRPPSRCHSRTSAPGPTLRFGSVVGVRARGVSPSLERCGFRLEMWIQQMDSGT